MAWDASFQHAIPGSSMAFKHGSFPHSRPPQFVKPNDALEYFWKQLHRPNTLKQLWYLQEKGVTSWAIMRALVYKAALEGIIQINLGMLLGKTLVDMITAIGKARGIDVKIFPKFKDPVADKRQNDALNELRGSKNFQFPKSKLMEMDLPNAKDALEAHKARQAAMQPEIQKQPQEQPKQGLLGMAQQGEQQ